jgi:glycosyltransferase involved in cell wall biosynthesis
MRLGLIVPGFSADERDWCIPALRHLVRELARGDEVRVLALRYPHRTGSYPLLGAHVTALGGGVRRGAGSLGLWRAALAQLAATHRRAPFEVLHALWATESGMLAAVAGRVLGVPAVVSVAGGELAALPDIGYGGQLARAERIKIRIALRLADTVTAGSAYACRMAGPYLRRGAGSRVVRLPLGVDLSLFHPAPATRSGGPPCIVQAASLVPVKGQATLLRALALLQARSVPFVAEIAGEGPLEGELRALADRVGLGEAVRFRGALPHDALPGFFRGATAFALSSHHEAQCMALLEAAACGVPTVGSAVGALPELAPDAALAVPPGDYAALAGALEALLHDDARRRAMGSAAARIVAEQYSAERCAELARAVYAAARGR